MRRVEQDDVEELIEEVAGEHRKACEVVLADIAEVKR